MKLSNLVDSLKLIGYDVKRKAFGLQHYGRRVEWCRSLHYLLIMLGPNTKFLTVEALP